jgi:Icc-related predicted phosphoesterase
VSKKLTYLWLPISIFFDTLKKAHEGVKDQKKTIMVTHMHPAGSKSEFTGFEGSSGIRKAIKEFSPDIAICAQIHEAGGLIEKIGKTWRRRMIVR